MTVRHPGRWLVGALLALLATSWLFGRALKAAHLGHLLWLMSSVTYLVFLFALSHRRGAHPSLFTIAATLVAGIVGAWLDTRLEARWWIRLVLLGVLGGPLMSVANAAYRA